jgi:hypothetical protein
LLKPLKLLYGSGSTSNASATGRGRIAEDAVVASAAVGVAAAAAVAAEVLADFGIFLVRHDGIKCFEIEIGSEAGLLHIISHLDIC